ncbi:hypothetical protein ACI79G_06520 [Geodermatophilus sp. SYSU D00779]
MRPADVADRVVERVAGYAATQVDGAAAAPRRPLGISVGEARADGEAAVRATVAVELADVADVAEVRRTLEDRVVAHARQAVDDPELPVDIELRPGRRSGSRGLF